MGVDFINVLSELAAGLSLNFLDFLETTALNECTLGLKILRKDFGELSTNVGKNVIGSQLEKRLKSRKVSAHLDDVLESLLSLILKILGRLREHVDSQKS